MNEKTIFLETIKIENGTVCNFDFHQRRLAETAYLHYKTEPFLDIKMSGIPQKLRDKRVKCRILYAEDILSVEFHAYQAKQIRSLQIVEDNNIIYNYKYADRSSLNRLLEKRDGADEIIILKNGKITDSSYSNLVFETRDGQLFTPESFLLNGTKRQFLLQNGTISEKEISVNDLHLYERVYFINAMLDLEDNISVRVENILNRYHIMTSD